jgi:hypothetical protein
MAVEIYKIFVKFTYSGAVFGAVDDETRSLDSFFFGVFVAIFIKALMFIFLQQKPKNFEIGANFADIFVFGYAVPRLLFSKGIFPVRGNLPRKYPDRGNLPRKCPVRGNLPRNFPRTGKSSLKNPRCYVKLT